MGSGLQSNLPFSEFSVSEDATGGLAVTEEKRYYNKAKNTRKHKTRNTHYMMRNLLSMLPLRMMACLWHALATLHSPQLFIKSFLLVSSTQI